MARSERFHANADPTRVCPRGAGRGPFRSQRTRAPGKIGPFLHTLGKCGAVLRIYLDQNKWVDLAHAARRDAKGEVFHDAYVEATRAAAQRTASFPLSSVHIEETCRMQRFKLGSGAPASGSAPEPAHAPTPRQRTSTRPSPTRPPGGSATRC